MKQVFITLLVLLAGGFEIQACSTDWVSYGTSCYAFVNEKVNWATAKEICRTLQSNLVEVNDAQESAFLVSAMKTRKFISVWMGMQDFLEEGQFVRTSDLKPATYIKWAPMDPNNHDAPEGGQDCVVLKSDGDMDDYHCTGNHHNSVVCENGMKDEIMNDEIMNDEMNVVQPWGDGSL